MPVGKEKFEALIQEMEKYEIYEDDLIEKFILGSGPGGQKVNKTHSCVYLKHVPSGFEVKCQRERSRELNRYYARKELLDKVKEEIYKIETKRKQEIEKIRKQKKRRSRKVKEKILEDKRRRSQVKEQRRPPKEDH